MTAAPEDELVAGTRECGMVVVVRAWLDDNQSAPIRARITFAPDVTSSLVETRMASGIDDVCAAIHDVLTRCVLAAGMGDRQT